MYNGKSGLITQNNDIPLHRKTMQECFVGRRMMMSQNPIIEKLSASQLRSDIPEFRPGDTVRVHALIVEGERERVQIFEGLVIKRRGYGISETYTVRKMSSGVGVERTFPVHSPRVAKIELVRKGKVRRAKLYYIRSLSGKDARIKERGR